MNIPNDTGQPWRLKKFVEYQHAVPPVGPPMIREYAKNHNLNKSQIVWLCYLYSVSYCEITAILMYETMKFKQLNADNIQAYWGKHKQKLQFCSSRQYSKSLDWAPVLITQFVETTNYKPYAWLSGFVGKSDCESYDNLYKHLKGWKYMGRFSIERVFQVLTPMCDHGFLPFNFKTNKVDWSKGSNLTAGILNIHYKDKTADQFMRGNPLPESRLEIVQQWCDEIMDACETAYPNQTDLDFTVVTSKICSFRNLFTGTRYAGFHHDRQLEILRRYEDTLPKFQSLWQEVYSIRNAVYSKKFLGEVGGWAGIRKSRKKLFLQEGYTGAEKDAPIGY